MYLKWTFFLHSSIAACRNTSPYLWLQWRGSLCFFREAHDPHYYEWKGNFLHNFANVYYIFFKTF